VEATSRSLSIPWGVCGADKICVIVRWVSTDGRIDDGRERRANNCGTVLRSVRKTAATYVGAGVDTSWVYHDISIKLDINGHKRQYSVISMGRPIL
jgi:hypothetical protein